ncbi:MAG: HAD family phosphatase [Chloroflexi bacterium]|nr:HAD family phosphatase [Chloroflexota bacterium]
MSTLLDESKKKINPGALAVLWDMDGVLIDTSPYHFAAWKQVMSQYGLDLNRNSFSAIFGLKNEVIIQKFFKINDTGLTQEIENLKETIFRKLIHQKITLLPGVYQWLNKFQSRHILQAVASSAPRENIDFLLKGAGILNFFSAIVSADSLPSKPDPSIFLKAASTLNITAQNCVVIEDAVYGIEAAHRAGMKCIAVGNSLSLHELRQADLVVTQLQDLTEDAFDNLFR